MSLFLLNKLLLLLQLQHATVNELRDQNYWARRERLIFPSPHASRLQFGCRPLVFSLSIQEFMLARPSYFCSGFTAWAYCYDNDQDLIRISIVFASLAVCLWFLNRPSLFFCHPFLRTATSDSAKWILLVDKFHDNYSNKFIIESMLNLKSVNAVAVRPWTHQNLLISRPIITIAQTVHFSAKQRET